MSFKIIRIIVLPIYCISFLLGFVWQIIKYTKKIIVSGWETSKDYFDEEQLKVLYNKKGE